jgi:endonuclease I
MKKLISSLVLLSFLGFTGCNQASQDIGLIPSDSFSQPQGISTYSHKNSIKADWFESLTPELQSYYAQAKGKTGAELFDALHNIISQNNKITDYLDSKSYMYATADNVNINNTSGLIDVYSYIFIPGSGGNGNIYKESSDDNNDGHPNDFINCEHTWPQSFFGKQLPMVADLHHMFPSTSVPNAMRSDNPFGEANKDGRMVIYTTEGKSGAKLGVIDSKHRTLEELKKLINLPYEQRPTLEKELDEVFEPGDQQKGNTARAMMYFYLKYYDKNIRMGDFRDDKFWDSKVSTFINWDENVDPVNDQERRRHEFVFKKQGNRNPFIDIPGLASMIGENVFKAK